MEDLFAALEKRLGGELVQKARVINDSYQTFLPEPAVLNLVTSTFGTDYEKILESALSLVPAHKFVNHFLMHYYPSERVIKYHLIRDRISRRDEVTTFELYVDSSRLDVARINGQSYAYEVKTQYDNLAKLSKQLADYGKVFEHVIVIAHESHLPEVMELCPGYCGIEAYSFDNGACVFESVRAPLENPMMDSEAQLRNLSAKDLEGALRLMGVPVPGNKEHRTRALRELCDSQGINVLFKNALKQKFKAKWAHIQSNFSRIEPIDVQAFFRSQADPDWVYYKFSSML